MDVTSTEDKISYFNPQLTGIPKFEFLGLSYLDMKIKT